MHSLVGSICSECLSLRKRGPPRGGGRKQRAKAPAGRFVTLPMLERGVMALPWGREVIAKIQG